MEDELWQLVRELEQRVEQLEERLGPRLTKEDLERIRREVAEEWARG